MNKFISHDRKYSIDKFGVIHQDDYVPYVYDRQYVATYDSPQYLHQSDVLQALRLGFTAGVHGGAIESLLDYGYGNGAFMKFARQNVETVIGYDLTGLHVDGCFILPHLVRTEVYTFWDALEHVPDLDFLGELHCKTLVVSLPFCHFFTQGKEWFDTQYKHRKPDEHLHHFNFFSLQNIMLYYGWRAMAVSGHEDVVRKSTHGLQNILSMAFKKI